MSGNGHPVLVRKVHRGLLESEPSELSLTELPLRPLLCDCRERRPHHLLHLPEIRLEWKTRRLPVFAQGASRHRSIPLDTFSSS
jgi:hypothetical protein